ncbi:MAG TPA: GvpL/GvpF family gas vesicle protein [Gemmatimonadaceae bacterium]|jgi:hypothetical protein|nr:GvpL/GvpF family gas vesicle protein [Gemmatimonadaceae bacterium]
MVTYLYCVLAPPKTEAFPSGLVGIADTPVRVVVVREGEGLEAWIATIDEATLRASGSGLAKLAIVHNEVVEAALATGRTPLPARFGTRFADDDALLSDLQERRAQLIDRLHRVAGAVEMSVLVVPRGQGQKHSTTQPRRDEPAAGRRYLEAVRERTRSEEQQRIEANGVAERVSQAVSVVTRGEIRSTSATVLSIAHLVRQDELERYRLELLQLDVGEKFRIIVAGPRAPYNFAADQSAPSQA